MGTLALKRQSSKPWRISTHPSDPAKGGVIYVLKDPRDEYKDAPIRYIGQTFDFGDRAKAYEKAWRNGTAHSPPLRHWFAKLKRLGLKYLIEVVDERLFAIGELERDWISRGRQAGWKLLNITDGGGGGGSMHTETSREKLRASSKAKWNDPDYRARWSASMKGVWAARPVISEEEQSARLLIRQANVARHKANMDLHADRVAAKNAILYPLTYRGTAFLKLGGNRQDGRSSGIERWALIDAEDWAKVQGRRWYANWIGRKLRVRSKRGGMINLTQVIGGTIRLTHCNRNGLDCRKVNLHRRDARRLQESL